MVRDVHFKQSIPLQLNSQGDVWVAMKRADFPFDQAGAIAAELLQSVYSTSRFYPAAQPVLAPLPKEQTGIAGFSNALQQVVEGSAALATPMMLGHMDTSPHPAAAFADAVVSALNNNLLFRELSPIASAIEEFLLDTFADRLGLQSDWHGTFVSGGSIANLTALFAATGGYQEVAMRGQCEFFIPECAHNSVAKALALLGIVDSAIHPVASDEQGRADPQALAHALESCQAKRKIVIAVLGSTVHGAVEDIAQLAKICRHGDAWLHVDAIYGGAVAFSTSHAKLLQGLDAADSVVIGPQKWLLVPRLSALVFIRGAARFDATLKFSNQYSASGLEHRGQWGLQGSRRADAVTLWVLLHSIGTRQLGEDIDNAIALTAEFYQLLCEHPQLTPAHQPDLNLQCFNYLSDSQSTTEVVARLGRNGIPWVSTASWRGKSVFRLVLLAPETTRTDLEKLLAVF